MALRPLPELQRLAARECLECPFCEDLSVSPNFARFRMITEPFFDPDLNEFDPLAAVSLCVKQFLFCAVSIPMPSMNCAIMNALDSAIADVILPASQNTKLRSGGFLGFPVARWNFFFSHFAHDLVQGTLDLFGSLRCTQGSVPYDPECG